MLQLLLLLLELLLDLKLLKLLLDELLLLLWELLSRSLMLLNSLTHDTGGWTPLHSDSWLRRDLCCILFILGLNLTLSIRGSRNGSARNNWGLQLRGGNDLFVRDLTRRLMACDIWCRGCSRFFKQFLCVFRGELLWLRMNPCCHWLFCDALRQSKLGSASSIDESRILTQGCQLEVKIVSVELCLNRVASQT